MTRPIDITVENRRGVYLFRPVTVAGKAWLESHLDAEPWQWTDDGAVAVEGERGGLAVIEALADAALNVGERRHWLDEADGETIQ